jgi:hypothetical protein
MNDYDHPRGSVTDAPVLRLPRTPEAAQLDEAKARDQVRSVSSYVGKLTVEELARG